MTRLAHPHLMPAHAAVHLGQMAPAHSSIVAEVVAYGRGRIRGVELANMPYREYLRSPEWAVTRELALQRARFACERCGSVASLQVHHLTYDRRGAELPADLTVLCGACHNRAHDLMPTADEIGAKR